MSKPPAHQDLIACPVAEVMSHPVLSVRTDMVLGHVWPRWYERACGTSRSSTARSPAWASWATARSPRRGPPTRARWHG
jgi:hypothetical protein